MNSDDSPIALFRRVVRLLEVSDDDPAAAAWFIAAAREYEAGAPYGRTIGHTLELEGDRRATGWWEQEALHRRNTMLREIRDRHFRQLSIRNASKAISGAVAHYSAGRWKLHRCDVAPPANADALTLDLFALMRLQEQLAPRRPRVPILGSAAVRSVLAIASARCDSRAPSFNGPADGNPTGDTGETDDEETERPRGD